MTTTLDAITKSILDIIKVGPNDKVKVTVEKKEDNSLHQMKVVVNKTEHEVSILYKNVPDFMEELPMYNHFFSKKGAIIEKTI